MVPGTTRASRAAGSTATTATSDRDGVRAAGGHESHREERGGGDPATLPEALTAARAHGRFELRVARAVRTNGECSSLNHRTSALRGARGLKQRASHEVTRENRRDRGSSLRHAVPRQAPFGSIDPKPATLISASSWLVRAALRPRAPREPPRARPARAARSRVRRRPSAGARRRGPAAAPASVPRAGPCPSCA